MNQRTEHIAAILRRWLERFSPPANIKDNPRAAQDSADALLKVLLRFAPQSAYEPWVNRALDQTEWQMKTRAWPTVHEIGAVCSNMRKDDPRAEVEQEKADPFEAAAHRIREGKPVGDMWLYGHHAHQIVARGYVSERQLEPYRSSLFFAMRDAWGSDKALEAEAELKRRHQDCAPTIVGNGVAA